MRPTWTLLALLTTLIGSSALAQEPPAGGRFSRCAFSSNLQGVQLYIDSQPFGGRFSPYELDWARALMLQADMLTAGNCSRFGWLSLTPDSTSGFVCSVERQGSTVRLYLDDFAFSDALDTSATDVVLAAVRAADQRASGSCSRSGWVERK